MHLSPYYFYLSLNIVCRVNFDMSVKLSSITTAATKFNFGKSNLYDFIFFKSCHFITFCISSLHHWVSFLLLFHARYFCKQFSASTLFCHHSSFDDIWEELKKRDRYIFECLNLNFEMWHLYFSHTEIVHNGQNSKMMFQMKQKTCWLSKLNDL